MLENFKKNYSDNHCLQRSLLIFKIAQNRRKESFVSIANKPLVGTLMKIGDVTENNTLFVERSVQVSFVHKLKNTQI